MSIIQFVTDNGTQVVVEKGFSGPTYSQQLFDAGLIDAPTLEATNQFLQVPTEAVSERVTAVETELADMPLSTLYTDTSIPALTAGQAAGTDPILPQDLTRKALKIQPPINCILSITAGAAVGVTLVGGFPNDFAAGECPANALYIKGLGAGAALTIWKA